MWMKRRRRVSTTKRETVGAFCCLKNEQKSKMRKRFKKKTVECCRRCWTEAERRLDCWDRVTAAFFVLPVFTSRSRTTRRWNNLISLVAFLTYSFATAAAAVSWDHQRRSTTKWDIRRDGIKRPQGAAAVLSSVKWAKKKYIKGNASPYICYESFGHLFNCVDATEKEINVIRI